MMIAGSEVSVDHTAGVHRKQGGNTEKECGKSTGPGNRKSGFSTHH